MITEKAPKSNLRKSFFWVESSKLTVNRGIFHEKKMVQIFYSLHLVEVRRYQHDQHAAWFRSCSQRRLVDIIFAVALQREVLTLF